MAEKARQHQYDPIEDWSVEGRARLAMQREDEIRLLLEEAFARFADEYPLAPFGFDSVEAAADFAFDRFAHGDLDPARIRAGSRSFRLCTEVRFWLAQKTGRGFAPIMARLRRMHEGEGEALASDDGDTEREAQRERTASRWAKTLQQLRLQTCADIVGYWLRATHRLRRDCFGWHEQGSVAVAASKPARSKHMHDALFRFQCLHHRLVQAGAPPDPALLAVACCLFSPCDNKPPYRAPHAHVAALLPAALASSPRAINRLWRAGLVQLLYRFLAAFDVDIAVEDPLELVLARVSVGRTTLHAYKITEAALADRLARFSAGLDDEEEI